MSEKALAALAVVGAGVSLYRQRRDAQEREELREALDDPERGETDLGPDRQMSKEKRDAMERLVQIEERDGRIPEARDATQSGTFDLEPGETAIIEAVPENGYVLNVKRVYVDRRDDHVYQIDVNGIEVSRTHEWEGNPPRRVSENEKVVVEVSNLSSSTTEMDYVLDMNGVESEACPECPSV